MDKKEMISRLASETNIKPLVAKIVLMKFNWDYENAKSFIMEGTSATNNTSTKINYFSIYKKRITLSTSLAIIYFILGSALTISSYLLTKTEYGNKIDFIKIFTGRFMFMAVFGACLIISSIISFILLPIRKKKFAKEMDQILKLKDSFPSIPELTIVRAFNINKRNIDKTTEYLTSISDKYINSSNNESTNKVYNKPKKNVDYKVQRKIKIGNILKWFGIIIFVPLWLYTAISHDPYETETFLKHEWIMLIIAFFGMALFFAGNVVGAGYSKIDEKAKINSILSCFVLLIALLIPAIIGKDYVSFLSKSIVLFIVVMIISGILGFFLYWIVLCARGDIVPTGNTSNSSTTKRKSSFWGNTNNSSSSSDHYSSTSTSSNYSSTSQTSRERNVKIDGKTYRVNSDGDIYSPGGSYIGKVGYDGTLYDKSDSEVGKIGSDGTVYNRSDDEVGKIGSDGEFYK